MKMQEVEASVSFCPNFRYYVETIHAIYKGTCQEWCVIIESIIMNHFELYGCSFAQRCILKKQSRNRTKTCFF